MRENHGSAGEVLVAGAGPKGIAIAVKAAALAAVGRPVPTVTVVDPLGIAAHWRGHAGYTDGRQRLGTHPEKDLGFPYLPSWGEHSVQVNRIMSGISWHSHLVAAGLLGEWVDRGRPRPTHDRWADYIAWAAETTGVRVRRARISRLSGSAAGWLAELTDPDGHHETVPADGIVLTGPGDARRLPGQPRAHPRLLDGRTIWQHLGTLRDLPVRNACVVGSGETAGAVTAALLEELGDDTQIEVVSTEGVLFTRGESFTESHMYTEPDTWHLLPERQRRAFIRRTDRGVFSVNVQGVLDQADRVRTVLGRVRQVHPGDDTVETEIDDGREIHWVRYDLVVVATGFDALWWLPLLSTEAHDALVDALGTADRKVEVHHVERAIGTTLAVAGLDPPLHLPVLAGPAQGPGFPNLSCLGLLSDRILKHYAPTTSAGPGSAVSGRLATWPS